MSKWIGDKTFSSFICSMRTVRCEHGLCGVYELHSTGLSSFFFYRYTLFYYFYLRILIAIYARVRFPRLCRFRMSFIFIYFFVLRIKTIIICQTIARVYANITLYFRRSLLRSNVYSRRIQGDIFLFFYHEPGYKQFSLYFLHVPFCISSWFKHV